MEGEGFETWFRKMQGGENYDGLLTDLVKRNGLELLIEYDSPKENEVGVQFHCLVKKRGSRSKKWIYFQVRQKQPMTDREILDRVVALLREKKLNNLLK